MTNESTAASTPPEPPAKKAKKRSLLSVLRTSRFSFLYMDPVATDVVSDEDGALRRRAELMTLVMMQTIAIGAFATILILGLPFFRPVYQYFALAYICPDGKKTCDEKEKVPAARPLASMTMPNLTNRAVLAWATISINEIMTMGFGNYRQHLLGQKFRFTPEGWESFSKAFDKQRIGESFEERQLVLTTVATNTPVIVSQGENLKHIYEWRVQMPVVMTYETNNNVTRREQAVVDMTIQRVMPDQSSAGIAIQTWALTQ